MNSFQSVLVAASAMLVLAGCETAIQTSSGADYLAGYDGSYEVPAGQIGSDVDADVRRIAAIEPNIRFPALIGLARIANGQLRNVPPEELEIWSEAAAELGDYGEFVPINTMIAAMVSDPRGDYTDRAWTKESQTRDVIAHIRRGAARQHVDYVLVYETGDSRKDKANGLAVADLTIVGMFVLPSRSVEIAASASGLLLDVRNGYPYATLTAHAEKSSVTRAVSQYSTSQRLVSEAELVAVQELAEDMEETLEELALVAAKRTSE